MAKETAADQTQSKLMALNHATQGVWRLGLYPRNSVPGPSEALASGIAAYLGSVRVATPDAPRLCMTCQTTFRHENAVAALTVLAPDVPGNVDSLVGGVCLTCAQRPGAWEAIRATYATALGISIRIIDGATDGEA